MLPPKATLLRWIQSRETPLAVQFAKYTVCGVLSLITFLAGTWLLSLCFRDFISPTLPPAERALHLNLLHLAAFIPANTVAYLTNRAFVFTPGRHRAHHELGLFFLVALLAFGIGLAAPEFLIRAFNAPNAVATLSFAASSALVNFVARKFLIFSR